VRRTRSMADLTETQRELLTLATDLKRLEAEYTMFFAGRLPRPPWETRKRVESLVRKLDRGRIINTADRFRFESLQARWQSMTELWERALRAREEGRPGPLAMPAPPPRKKKKDGEVVHVTAFTDPVHETGKLRSLYDSLMEARKGAGEDVVPFHKFAALVSSQVKKLRQSGSGEVAFRVAKKDGKVNLTVRGSKGTKR
jgi:hypothetical protein